MNKTFRIISCGIIISVLSGCASTKDIVPPAWQSWGAFKESIVGKSPRAPKKPEIAVSEQIIPSITITSPVKQKISGMQVSVENILDTTTAVRETYEYEQWSSTQITPGYERFKRTTNPSAGINQTYLQYKVTFLNTSEHPVGGQGLTPSILINSKAVKATMKGDLTFIPDQPQSIIVTGPRITSLNANDVINLNLYNVATKTNPDGSVAVRSKFGWKMVLNTKTVKFEKPLYKTQKSVKIHYKDALRNNIGICYTKRTFRNSKGITEAYNEEWVPEDNRWYSRKEWKRARKKGRFCSPSNITLNKKLGRKW